MWLSQMLCYTDLWCNQYDPAQNRKELEMQVEYAKKIVMILQETMKSNQRSKCTQQSFSALGWKTKAKLEHSSWSYFNLYISISSQKRLIKTDDKWGLGQNQLAEEQHGLSTSVKTKQTAFSRETSIGGVAQPETAPFLPHPPTPFFCMSYKHCHQNKQPLQLWCGTKSVPL